MRFSTLALYSTAATLAAAAPFSYPLANEFPELNSNELAEVFKLAGGTVPNGGLPKKLSHNAIQALQLIAANEFFETAFFTELLNNITTKVPGYETVQLTTDSLVAVVKQEQVHVLAANGVIASAKATTIQPCKYSFPVTTFDEAIALCQTFTDLVLGVLPGAQSLFSKDGGEEAGLVPIVGSIIAQEGQQDGLYRILQKKVASAAPLLTGAAPQFAFSAISQFIVPGSCPNIDVIGLTATPALTVETKPHARNSTQLFSVSGKFNADNVSLTYISGQNLPVTVPISDVNEENGKTFFCASFPFEAGFARGLTIGALVKGSNPTFKSNAEVAAATLYGPALIEVE